MVALPLVIAVRRCDAAVLRRWGGSIALLGLLGFAVYGTADVLLWLRDGPDDNRHYVVQRVVLFTVSRIDVPILHVTGAGFVAWRIGQQRANAGEAALTPPEAPA